MHGGRGERLERLPPALRREGRGPPGGSRSLCAKSIVSGSSCGRGSPGSVKKTCRFSRVTGMSTPAVAASSRDHTPAVTMTREVATRPSSVSTPATRPASTDDRRCRAPCTMLAATRGRRARVALHGRLRRGVAVDGAERGGKETVRPNPGDDLRRLVRRQQRGRNAEPLLELDRMLERRQVPGVAEQEQVPPLLEVDLSPGRIGEALVPADALEPDPDVQLIGELGPNSARRLARRAGTQGLPLDQEGVRGSPPLRGDRGRSRP